LGRYIARSENHHALTIPETSINNNTLIFLPCPTLRETSSGSQAHTQVHQSSHRWWARMRQWSSSLSRRTRASQNRNSIYVCLLVYLLSYGAEIEGYTRKNNLLVECLAFRAEAGGIGQRLSDVLLALRALVWPRRSVTDLRTPPSFKCVWTASTQRFADDSDHSVCHVVALVMAKNILTWDRASEPERDKQLISMIKMAINALSVTLPAWTK
jgi:hypothetical protein